MAFGVAFRAFGLRAQWSRLAESLRSSLWALPSALIVLAIVAVVGTLSLDRHLGYELSALWWPLGAGVEGTRSTLAVIAGSVMTVAGVSFSMTIVVLQLASSQYSPRVVRSFRRDRMIQAVLGVFVGTFMFALIAMRTIAAGDEGAPFTAPVTVTVALALGTTSMVMLVVLVHHVARMVQVSSIIGAIEHEAREALDHLFPEMLGEAEEIPPPEPPPSRGADPGTIRAPRDGYVQYVDAGEVDAIGGAELVRLEHWVGEFVREGDVLASVWPARERECDAHAASAFVIGAHRTMHQDVRYGVRLLVDIALRALSPGVNDPTTAVDCVNAIGALLCCAARRRFPVPTRRTDRGLIVYAPRPSIADLIGEAFEEIVSAADRSPPVQLAVLDALSAIARRDPRGHHGEALRAIATRTGHVVASAEWPEIDRARVLDGVAALGARAPRGASRREAPLPLAPVRPR